MPDLDRDAKPGVERVGAPGEAAGEVHEERREPRWPATWIRALLPSAVLACLEPGPLHGYGIGRALNTRGFGSPKGGSLYPVLGKLEDSGAITAQWVPGPSGPARRQYTLTPAGSTQLTQERAALAELTAALSSASTGSAEVGTAVLGAAAPDTAAALDTAAPDTVEGVSHHAL